MVESKPTFASLEKIDAVLEAASYLEPKVAETVWAFKFGLKRTSGRIRRARAWSVIVKIFLGACGDVYKEAFNAK